MKTLTMTDILSKLSFTQRRNTIGNFYYKGFRGVLTDGQLALFSSQEIEGKSAFRDYYPTVGAAVQDINKGLVKL